MRAFCHAAGTLGDKLGVLLFQLGPTFKMDLAVFDAFLLDLPPGARAAFEFRHASWFDDDVYERLRAAQPRAVHRRQRRALDPASSPTADYGYFRLRDEGYTDADIDHWAETIRAHQDAGKTRTCTSSTRRKGKGRSSPSALMRRLDLPDRRVDPRRWTAGLRRPDLSVRPADDWVPYPAFRVPRFRAVRGQKLHDRPLRPVPVVRAVAAPRRTRSGRRAVRSRTRDVRVPCQRHCRRTAPAARTDRRPR